MAFHARLSLDTTYALLFSQFFAANIWSMLLFIGNPTNIVVALAFQLDFLGYSKWMAAPTVCAGLTCLLLLYFFFSSRNSIPLTIEIPTLNARSNLVDLRGAIFGSIIFGISICLIAVSSTISVPIWIITVIGCALMFLKDLVYDVSLFRRSRTLHSDLFSPSSSGIDENTSKVNAGTHDYELSDLTESTSSAANHSVENDQSSPSPEPLVDLDPSTPSPVAVQDTHILDSHASEQSMEHQRSTNPYLIPVVLSRLPWKVAPFVVAVFILVESMDKTGLVGLMATWFSAVVGPSDSSGAVFLSVFLAGFTSSIACNIVNNQPMTIMYTKILQSPYLSIGPVSLTGAMFSVVIGSNLGGNMTLLGALAGIMWKSILTSKGIPLSPARFAAQGCLTMILVLIICCMALFSELLAWS